jgi:subtilisin family serine protease
MTELWRQLRWYRAAASATRQLVQIGTTVDGCVAVENELIASNAAVALMDSVEVDSWEDATPSSWASLNLRYFQLESGEPVATAIPRLRAVVQAAAGAAYDPQVHRVSYNHAFSGEPFYRGGPGEAPVDSVDGWGVMPVRRDLPAKVAVLDTGFAPVDGASIDPGVEYRNPEDVDECRFNNEKWLGAQAGHGTFISGIVLRFSEGVGVKNVKVLDPDGWGSEDSIIEAINAVGRDADIEVLNLSLGGNSEFDERPAICEAIDALPPRIAVVAAAGNYGESRKFWPAADTRPIAVAALTQDLLSLTTFSNRGSWVNAGAVGAGLLSVGATGTFLVDEDQEVELKGWTSWSGTSFAAPLVAAIIARRAVDDQLTGDEAWRRIETDLLANGRTDWGVTLDVKAVGNGYNPNGV